MSRKITLGVLAFLIAIQADSAQAVNFCSWIFGKKSQAVALPPKKNAHEIKDLKSFGSAMTEGMLLHPEQGDLFEIYRNIFFGNPATDVDRATLKTVTDLTKKNPDLQKVPFNEIEILNNQKVYETPEALAKYIKSQIQTAGQTRSNLLKIEANLGYWKKILDYQEPTQPEGLTKDQQKEFSKKAKATFDKFLNRIISKTNRYLLADLNNENEDYQNKTKSLYKTLEALEAWLHKKGRNTQPIRQAMVDLVHTVGYANQATVLLLKSKNGMDKIEGLKKILDERDEVAMALGFADHFQELQQKLQIDFPTGFSKNESPQQNILNFENQVLASSSKSLDTEVIRVRSLSLQESPFRSCLGGSDCSTRTYFSKALDPNFYYFTMTDSNHFSSGHVTVVLGDAQMPKNNQLVKVAFVDKIQNVPNHLMITFLKAISMSLSERGYKLVLPKEVGGHNGLSNMDTTRHFIKNEILPHLTDIYTEFKPHEHKYNFKNKFSRANDLLDVLVFDPQSRTSHDVLKSGKKYVSTLAPHDLSKENLVESFLQLRFSEDSNDKLKYISSGSVVAELSKLNLFTSEEYEFDLEKFAKDPQNSLSVRKQAAFSLFILEKKVHNWVKVLEFFNDAEKKQILMELQQWSLSNEFHKKAFAKALSYGNYQYHLFMDGEKSGDDKNYNDTLPNFYTKLTTSLAIARSTKAEDQLRYIQNPKIAEALKHTSFEEEGDYENNIQKIYQNKKNPFEVRKEAFLAYIVEQSKFDEFDFDVSDFNSKEKKLIQDKVESWKSSHEPHIKEFLNRMTLKWEELISLGDIEELEKFEEYHLFNVNSQNMGGYPAFLLAIHYQKKEVIDWMLNHRDLDLKTWHRSGYNILEQAKLFGYGPMVEYIEDLKPELKTQNISVQEREENGLPVINFVKIPSGSFYKGAFGGEIVRITQPIEMMSVPTTQVLWYDMISVGIGYANDFNKVRSKPSEYSGSHKPVENVSYNEVKYWIDGLNKISQLDKPNLQAFLVRVLPGHQLGDFYTLPTEVEWEYVARSEGLVSGSYLFGKTAEGLEDYAWSSENAKDKTHPVGAKKPLYINGQPIYDIQGNVAEWISSIEYKDRPHDEFRDIHASATEALTKGVFYFYKIPMARIGYGANYKKDFSNSFLGFRLIRIRKP